MLIVARNPWKVGYQWNKNGKSGTGHKLEVVLMSEDSTQYCEDVFRKKGKEPQATKDVDAAKDKFATGTIWKLSKASLTNDNPKYVGCSCKVVIDMRNSTFEPVLQSTAQMPKQVTPPADLNTLLQCAGGQAVEVLALVKEVIRRRCY